MRAIEVSVDSLEPEDRKRYLELAVFPEDTEVPEAALQLLWGLNQYDTADLADHFADLSLARLNAGRLSLHDLQHDFAIKRAGDLAALHGKLVDAYRMISPDGWNSGPDDGYFFQHIGYHLLHSERRNELKGLLLDLRWLQSRLEKTDLTSLISDFDLLPEDEDIRLCQSCLQLSSHVLFRDPDQLAGQLLGRMQHLELPGIKALTEQARGKKDRPWLRPMTASLTPPGGALIRTLVGHHDVVRAAALTNDGRRAVSASGDRTLKVWDIESGKVLKTLLGHDGWVNAIALTNDGRRVVSASDDKTLKVWDIESGKVLKTLLGHDGGVRAVALTNDGRWAVSASDDRTLKVWDIESGKVLKTLLGHDGGVRAVALTNEGRRAVSASDDKTLKVWDIESGKVLKALQGHDGWVYAIALTNDGRWVVSASDDKTLKVWDIESGKVLKTLQGHNYWVYAVALTNDGRMAVSASEDRTLKVWDIESGKVLKTLLGHDGGVRAVALTNDGKRAVSASEDKTLKVWDIESGSLIASFTGDSSIVACAIAPDDLTIVAGEASGRVHFLRLEGYNPSRKSNSLPQHGTAT